MYKEDSVYFTLCILAVAIVWPLDLLLLLLLYDVAPAQWHPIESMIRNKIHSGLLSDAMLGHIFTTHSMVG